MFEEGGKVDFMVLFKSYISDYNFGLNKIHIDVIVIEFGVIVRNE